MGEIQKANIPKAVNAADREANIESSKMLSSSLSETLISKPEIKEMLIIITANIHHVLNNARKSYFKSFLNIIKPPVNIVF